MDNGGMLPLQDFIVKYFDVPNTGDTSANQGQCVGLIEDWLDNLGLPHDWGDAKDLLTNADSNSFDIIQNTANNYPVAGDIMVWGSTWGGGFGHTGVVVAADANRFSTFEQNDSTSIDPSGYPDILTHDYTGVLGWLHPKNLIQGSNESALTQCQTDRDENWNIILAIFGALGAQLDPNNKEGSKQDAIDRINQIKQQHDIDYQTIIGLKGDLSKLNDDDRNFAQEALDAQHATQGVIDDRKTIYEQLNVSNTKDAIDTIKALQTPHEDLFTQVQPLLEGLAEAAFKRTKSPQAKSFIQNIKSFLGLK